MLLIYNFIEFTLDTMGLRDNTESLNYEITAYQFV